MLLSEINGSVCIDPDDNYYVEVSDAPFLMLSVPMVVGTLNADFDHPNMLAAIYESLEFKHYRRSGTKFWTSKPGVCFYFVVPNDRIELVMEKTHSFPKIIIGGKTVTLSTSGGTIPAGGWTDYIGARAGTLVNMPKRTLKAIADNALTVAEVKKLGICLPEKEKTEEKHTDILTMVSKTIVGPQLDKDWKIQLGYSYSISGSKGPFTISHPRRKKSRSVIVEHYPGHVKCSYKHIDWLETAKLNDIELPALVDINRIPKTSEMQE